MGCCFSKDTIHIDESPKECESPQLVINTSATCISPKYISLRAYAVLTPTRIEEYRKEKCSTNLKISGTLIHPSEFKINVTTDLSAYMYMSNNYHKHSYKRNTVHDDNNINYYVNSNIQFPALPKRSFQLY